MRRREVLALLAGFAASPQPAAGAKRIRRLGFLTTASGPARRHHALEDALADLGYQAAGNLAIERRYAVGNLELLPALAIDLVRANVDVIVTETTPAALAAKKATSRIPIVMATAGDALGSGLADSLARPGGNVTGMTFRGTDLASKRLEVLRELKPEARRFAFFGNSRIIPEQLAFAAMRSIAESLGIEATFIDAPMPESFQVAFATMAAAKIEAVSVAESAVNTEACDQLVVLAARDQLPAIYGRREFTDAGGLVSYGANFEDLFRRAAVFVDKIFKGSNPADIPIEQSRKFELVLHGRTARTLGLTIPRSLLARADEVIE